MRQYTRAGRSGVRVESRETGCVHIIRMFSPKIMQMPKVHVHVPRRLGGTGTRDPGRREAGQLGRGERGVSRVSPPCYSRPTREIKASTAHKAQRSRAACAAGVAAGRLRGRPPTGAPARVGFSQTSREFVSYTPCEARLARRVTPSKTRQPRRALYTTQIHITYFKDSTYA